MCFSSYEMRNVLSVVCRFYIILVNISLVIYLVMRGESSEKQIKPSFSWNVKRRWKEIFIRFLNMNAFTMTYFKKNQMTFFTFYKWKPLCTLACIHTYLNNSSLYLQRIFFFWIYLYVCFFPYLSVYSSTVNRLGTYHPISRKNWDSSGRTHIWPCMYSWRWKGHDF